MAVVRDANVTRIASSIGVLGSSSVVTSQDCAIGRMTMKRNRRELTDDERFVLSEVQACWGDQNTEDKVFFTDQNEAALFVVARDGSNPVMVSLTNLGEWHHDGTLSSETLRQHIKGPA